MLSNWIYIRGHYLSCFTCSCAIDDHHPHNKNTRHHRFASEDMTLCAEFVNLFTVTLTNSSHHSNLPSLELLNIYLLENFSSLIRKRIIIVNDNVLHLFSLTYFSVLGIFLTFDIKKKILLARRSYLWLQFCLFYSVLAFPESEEPAFKIKRFLEEVITRHE